MIFDKTKKCKNNINLKSYIWKRNKNIEMGDIMTRLGIIYGGISTEHDVSEMSAKSVIENLDKEKI